MKRPNHAEPAADVMASPVPAPAEEIVWVAIEQLRLGMFVHPMSRTRFLLERKCDLDELIASGASGMFVDLAKSRAPRPERGGSTPMPKRLPPDPAANQAPALLAVGGSRRADAFAGAMATLARVQKPVKSLLDDARLGKAASSSAVASIVDEITQSVETDAHALISLARIRTKDRFTYAHSIAVCALMTNLASRLGLDRAAQYELGVAGLLHDVGKMLIPETVLNKPGKLTGEEMRLMRSHVVEGHDLLRRSGNLPAVALDVCLNHHEKIDGSGYPHGAAGEKISLAARMGAICDVYDAITSNRPYKEAWSPSECLANMFTWHGHFDEAILAQFIRSVGIFPVGSLVRMESGHLAVVTEQDEADLTRPVVRRFYAIASRKRVPLRDVALGRDAGDAILSREEPVKWGFADWDRQWPRMLSQ